VDTTILALDPVKFNSILCWYQAGTRAATYCTARTTAAEFRHELARQPAMA